MIKRWKITLEYDGTDYYGWQKQPDVPTIQEKLETALYKFCQQEIPVQCAGRTDAGVHALAQIAHFDLDYDYETRNLGGFELMKAINGILYPEQISVLKAEHVPDDFHARFDAKTKTYMYKILNRTSFPTLDKNRAWHFKRKLNAQKMHDAAQILVGKHDFSTFRDAQCQAKTPIRTLDRINVHAEECQHSGGQEITIEAMAQSFIHHQVRNIVGTLTLIGEEKWGGKDLKDALEAKDRTKGGMTAPACGLYLKDITYQ